MNESRARAALDAAAADAERLLSSTGADVASIVDARRDTSTDDEHDPEGATLAFERSQAEALGSSATRRLAEIDAARQRLADGLFGLCEICAAPIPEGRLEARPWATRCIIHAA